MLGRTPIELSLVGNGSPASESLARRLLGARGVSRRRQMAVVAARSESLPRSPERGSPMREALAVRSAFVASSVIASMLVASTLFGSGLPAAATPSVAEPHARAVAPGDIEITEIMYNAPGGDDHDWIEIVNRSGAALDISGFEFDGVGLTFEPGTSLPSGVPVVVVADRAVFSADHPEVGDEAIITEFGGRLSDGGERLTIRDALGAEVFSARYDDGDHWPVLADGFGNSLEYLGDFSITGMALTPDHPLAWRASLEPGGTPADMPASMPREPIVVVNEIIAATDPPYEDAIELFNPNEMTIDVTGWFLSDRRNDVESLRRYSIPGILVGATVRFPVVPPFGYLVLYEADFGDSAAEGNFRLSGDGEGVYLSAPNAAGDGLSMVRGADFAASETNRSYGRHVTSVGWDFTPLDRPTFGVDAPVSVEGFRLGSGADNAPPTVGPLVIDESLIQPADSGAEFVELRNVTDSAIELWSSEAMTSTYRLNDAITFYFGPGDTIAPGGRIVITEADPLAFRSERGVPDEVPVVGPYSGGLNNQEEVLRLQRRLFDGGGEPRGWLPIDHLAYEARSPWPLDAFGAGHSLLRVPDPLGYGNDPASWTSGALGGSPGRDDVPGTTPTATATGHIGPTAVATESATPTPSPGPGTEPAPTATATPLFCACDIWMPYASR